MTLVLALAAALAGQAAPLVLEGPVPDDGLDFFEVPFDVPAGTAELEVAHAPLDDEDTLDWGLFDADGAFRGYGGGNLEPAVVGVTAASRSYLPGPLPAGTWRVLVGKARLLSAAPGYRIEVTLRETATLAEPTDRRAWSDPGALVDEPRFYAGDFHVHSEDSGDADATLDEIAALAVERGLDFVVITDHNTTSHVDRLLAAQERALAAHGRPLLFVPGAEFTTYAGHATAFGATRYVDQRLDGGRTIDDAVADVVAQDNALFSINHPALDLGDVCIGCAWEHPLPPVGQLHGVEIQTGRTLLFVDAAIRFWEDALDAGHHAAAIGGSDDHNAGRDNAAIGEPTTLVFADALSIAALARGVRDSRTVVKVQDPTDPLVVLETSPARVGDTATAPEGTPVVVTATVTGGVGKTFRFVENGLGVALPEAVTSDPQTFTLERLPDGAQRVRAEVADDDGTPRTVTSYVWLAAGPPTPEGCACDTSAGGAPWGLACLALILARSRRWRDS